MVNHSTNEFRPGLKLLLDGDPCSIVENEFVKPGKGQAFNRVRLRNLCNGRIWERTFKSGESLPAADVLEREMSYLYSDTQGWHFMDDSSYEQYCAGEQAVAEVRQWLSGQDRCMVMLWNGEPLSVRAPNFVELEVTQTEPGLRGDTAAGGVKPAELSTGAVVRVPLFIEIGDRLRVDTRTGAYQGRVGKG